MIVTCYWNNVREGSHREDDELRWIAREPTFRETASGFFGIRFKEPVSPWNQGGPPPLLDGDPAALPVLLELLHADSAKVRAVAAAGLGTVGPAAREAVPDLLQACQDEWEVELEARHSLKLIDPSASIPKASYKEVSSPRAEDLLENR